jgi:small-conductance mechanosensitive channel
VFLAIAWLAFGILVQVTWPSQTYFLRLVANFMTAWIVISLSSSLIRNPVFGRFIALFAWGVAALNITGLLDPTIAALDSAALTLGDLRISLLTVVKGVVSFAVLLWGAVALSRLLETRINRIPNLTPSVQVLLGKLTKVTLLSIAVVFSLKSIGIDLTALAVLSGAVGLGIGFSLQKVVSNLFSGIILLLDKSIKPGDVIELEETFGWITSLGARYVSVVTRDGKEYLIPNEDLITHRVVNWSYSSDLVRLELQFGVSYDCDPHAVRKLAREAAATVNRVVGDPAPVCHLAEFADSSLNFLLRFWIRDPAGGVANVRGEVLLALWDAFMANGIAIPYPHREIILRRAGGAEPSTARV